MPGLRGAILAAPLAHRYAVVLLEEPFEVVGVVEAAVAPDLEDRGDYLQTRWCFIAGMSVSHTKCQRGYA